MGRMTCRHNAGGTLKRTFGSCARVVLALAALAAMLVLAPATQARGISAPKLQKPGNGTRVVACLPVGGAR